MKKLICSILLGLFAFPCYSQISVWKASEELSYQKPPVYDSLHVNLESFQNVEAYNYLQYVGQKLYFKPLATSMKKGYCFEDFIVNIDSVLEGPILLPFNKTDVGIVMESTIQNANKQNRKQLIKQKEQLEAKYMGSFSFPSHIYKPIFTTYNSMGSSGKVDARIGSDLSSLENKSFLILNVFNGNELKDTVTLVPGKKPVTEQLLFMLADEKGDTLYWKTYMRQISQQNHFIIQGFYDKQIAFYKNQILVYRINLPYTYITRGDRRDGNDYEKIIASNMVTLADSDFKDINSHQQVEPADLSLWRCRDIALIEDDVRNDLFYILENETGKTIKVPIGELTNKGFVCKESYDSETAFRKMKKEEQDALYKEKEKRQQEFNMARKKNLILQYGQRYGTLISEGNVVLGMSKQMCAESWGDPGSIIQNLTGEIWVYSYLNSLYFVQNKLVQIVNL